MRYVEFRDAIHSDLRKHPEGFTWEELRERNRLPYDRPCGNWTRRLETEIELKRVKRSGKGNALVWML